MALDPNKIVVSSLLALAALGAQAEQAISSASAYIDNLSYRLVDLAPDDGIAPGVVFGWDPAYPWATDITAHFGYRPLNNAGDGYEIYGNAPFRPSFPENTSRGLLGWEYGGATATYTTERFGMAQDLSTAYMTNQELAHGPLQWVKPNEGIRQTGFQQDVSFFTPIQLTPNTELIIEGTLVQGVQVDPLAFANDPTLSAALTSLRGHSEIMFSVAGGSFSWPNQYTDTPFSSSVAVDYEIDRLGNLAMTSTSGLAVSRNWSYRVANATSGYEDGQINFKFDAKTTAVGVVPEPATWALMLAGLGLTGLFARRRQVA